MPDLLLRAARRRQPRRVLPFRAHRGRRQRHRRRGRRGGSPRRARPCRTPTTRRGSCRGSSTARIDRRCTPHLSALHARTRRRRAHGVRRLVVPRRPLLDAGRLRARRRARHARGEPPRPERRRLRARRTEAGAAPAFPVSRGAAPLRRLGAGRARRRAHVPLDGGASASSSASRCTATATTPASCGISTSRREDASWVGARAGGRPRRRRFRPLALQDGPAAADRDRGLRPRRHRRPGRPRPHARRLGERSAVRLRAAAARPSRRQRRLCRRGASVHRLDRGEPRAGRDVLVAVDRGKGLDDRAGTTTGNACTRARSPTRRSSCSAPAQLRESLRGARRFARTSTSSSRRSATTARCPPRTISTPASPSPGTGRRASPGSPRSSRRASSTRPGAPARTSRSSTPGTARRRTSTWRRPRRTATPR